MVAQLSGGSRRDAARRDEGYAWVVLFAGFMLQVFGAGNFCILGIFMVEFLHHFQVTKATVTWIGALNMSVGFFTGPLIGLLIRCYGPRVVAMGGGVIITSGFLVCGIWPNLPVIYVVYGAVTSIGFVAINMSGMVAVQQYFVKRRALATGIFMTGLSVGTFALPPLVRFAIDMYRWPGALVIVAGVMAHTILFGTLLRPLRTPRCDRVSNLKDNVEKLTLSHDEDEYSRTPTFWEKHSPFVLFLIGYFPFHMCHNSVFTYTPLRCDAIGVSKKDASFLLAIMGFIGLFARPAFGWLGDRRFINKTIMFGISGLGVGVLTLTTTLLLDFPRLVSTAASFGVISAGYMAVQGAVLVDIAGISRIEVATGAFMAVIGLANFVVLMSTGYIMDYLGDANAPFLISGSAGILGAILVLCVPILRRRLRRGLQYDVTMESPMEVSSYEPSRDKSAQRRIYNKPPQITKSTSKQ